MDIVSLSVGQGGAQVGEHLMKLMPKSDWKWVIVDSEPKVVRKLGRMHVQPRVVIDESGSGNNWALGYSQTSMRQKSKSWDVRTRPALHGPDGLISRSLDELRHTIEACDRYSGTFMLHSLGGGTGSGLGSRLVQSIRDAMPKSYLFTASILPFAHGDTPLQHYNTSLSLSWLEQYCDGILIFDNEQMASLGSKGLKRGAQSSPFQHTNSYIARCIAGLLYPIRTYEHVESVFESGALRPLPLGQLATSCFSYSKFAEAYSSLIGVEWSTRGYDSHVKAAIGCLPRFADSVKTVVGQAMLVVRGYEGERRINTPGLNIAKWSAVDGAIDVVKSWDAHPFDGPSAAICCSTNRLGQRFADIISRSQNMVDVGAYVHWYEKYGVSREDIQNANSFVQDRVISVLKSI